MKHDFVVGACVACAFGVGLVMGLARSTKHEKVPPEGLTVLECTLADGNVVEPLSVVEGNIVAVRFGNTVVWSVVTNNGLPKVYEQKHGSFCTVRNEK